VAGGKWAQGIEEESDELNEDSRPALPIASGMPGLTPSKGQGSLEIVENEEEDDPENPRPAAEDIVKVKPVITALNALSDSEQVPESRQELPQEEPPNLDDVDVNLDMENKRTEIAKTPVALTTETED